METIERTAMDKERAKVEIMAILQRVALMGANDYELGAIQDILKRLEDNLIEPEEVLCQASVIENRKQDYH